jgi:hypothetical protein
MRFALKIKEKIKMKKLILLVVTFMTVFTLSACTDSTEPCGAGTELQGDVCVLIDDSVDENACPDDEVSFDGECTSLEDLLANVGTGTTPVCTNETGLHSVAGGKPFTISSWLNWTFIGGHLVVDPDNAWIRDFGAATFNVKTVAQNAWEGSFTQSKMFLTEGCEYTFEFTLRTEAPSIKPNVIVFGENTSGLSFFEEVVPLTVSSQTFSFTVIPTTSDFVSTGVYFAGSTGMVIIEEIQIQRNPIGTN